MSDTSSPRLQPIASDFADDPEMKELVRLFTTELPNRVGAIQAACESREIAVLRRAVHQLKGASGGYGYPTIGQAAKAVEDRLRDVTSGDEPSWKGIKRQVDQLADLCRRAALTAQRD